MFEFPDNNKDGNVNGNKAKQMDDESKKGALTLRGSIPNPAGHSITFT